MKICRSNQKVMLSLVTHATVWQTNDTWDDIYHIQYEYSIIMSWVERTICNREISSVAFYERVYCWDNLPAQLLTVVEEKPAWVNRTHVCFEAKPRLITHTGKRSSFHLKNELHSSHVFRTPLAFNHTYAVPLSPPYTRILSCVSGVFLDF